MNKLWIVFLIGFNSVASASFLETSKRYVSPADMFTLLSQKFPLLDDPQMVKVLKPSCWTIGGKNTNLTGLVNPAIGLPATSQPGAGFVRWWGDCADRIIRAQFGELKGHPTDQKLWRRYWAESVLNKMRDTTNALDPYHKLVTSDWSALKNRDKDEQIRFLIEEWIGPNAVIADLKIAKGTDELIGLLKLALGTDPMTIFEANQKLILAVMMREEFLSY